MLYSKADFNKHIDSLIPNGFTKTDESCRFERRYIDRVETISYSHSPYFPHGVYFKGVVVNTSFTEVEKIVNSFLEEYKIKNRFGNTTIQRSLVNLNSVNYKIFDTEITDDKSFEIAANEVNKIVTLGALPFFEKYSNLIAISESLKTMSDDEISVFISGIVGIKVPLIKKLTNAEDFIVELWKRNLFYSSEVFEYPEFFKDHEKVFYDVFREDLKGFSPTH